VLLLEDYQLQIDPQFIELINSLLAAGEVPGLYTPEELDPLLSPLRDAASVDGHTGTLYSFLAKRKPKICLPKFIKFKFNRNKKQRSCCAHHGHRRYRLHVCVQRKSVVVQRVCRTVDGRLVG
jgi:hypothetical protein